MNNYRNNRKNRFKSNSDRSFRKRIINGHKSQNEYTSNVDFKQEPWKKQSKRLKVDKYNNLAREALSIGDKILSENYLQHADHFSRVLSTQEINKTKSDNNVIEQNFKKDIDPIDVEESKNKNIVDKDNNLKV